MDIQPFIKRTARTLDTNSPLILTGLGVAGTISATILAVKATWRAATLEQRFNVREDHYPSKKELVQLVWAEYIPTLGMVAVTATCIIGAQSINTKRQAALISGITIADTAFREYREKIIEQIGVRDEQKARDAVAQAKLDRNPISSEVVVLGKGEVLFMDSYTERYFMSDMESIRTAQNDLNREIILQNYASLNDFYQIIGLNPTSLGNELGWNTDVMLEISFTTKITDDKRPCIVINYNLAPVREYYHFG